VLQRQYEKSYFYTNHSTKKPTKLAIFDFDSTLFFSPLLSPTIWHPNLIRVATTESVYGPGWWRDIRSLDLGPFEDLQKSAWKGFWNEDIVNEARQCIADPETMTVVLTGRRFHPFHHLIPAMLDAKGLQFDLVGLRPDPESVSDHHWEVMQGKHQLAYNLTSSVFKSTMHFKTCFILNLIHNVPSIDHVTMWDDRMPHVRRFREYLDVLTSQHQIDQGHVVYVPGIRPKYNPDWEKLVIRQIIQTHNKALITHHRDGIKNGKMEQRLTWNNSKLVEKEDPLDSTSHPLQLFPLPAATIIKLSPQCTEQLQKAYESIFKSQLEKNRKSQQWKDAGGEQPIYFGDSVYLSQKVLNNKSISVGNIGSEVEVMIKAYSDSPTLTCLLLKVQVKGDCTDYILPLWFKPSEYIELFRMKEVKWIQVEHDESVSGKVDFAYRLGVVEKTSEKRRRGSTSEQEEKKEENVPHTRRRL
jgi:hypothetical protein